VASVSATQAVVVALAVQVVAGAVLAVQVLAVVPAAQVVVGRVAPAVLAVELQAVGRPEA